jgi:shikimate kinase
MKDLKSLNIVLIGFMGSGKSYVGELLAQKLDFEFVDTDEMIAQKTGLSIVELFKEKGEEYFRFMETETVKELQSKKRMVLSTGGGLPCFHNNIELLNKIGKVIYLNVSVDTLLKRLKNEISKRPLLKDKNESELKTYISSQLENRKSYYEQADLLIGENDSIEEIIEKLKLI